MKEDLADEIMHLGAACGRWRSQAPKDGGRWSRLPRDVLGQIMCRLPSIRHCLRLAAICQHWRRAVHPLLPCSLPKLCMALPDGSLFTFKAGSSVLMPRFFTFEAGCFLMPRGSYRGTPAASLSMSSTVAACTDS